jgi:hypothetical protein
MTPRPKLQLGREPSGDAPEPTTKTKRASTKTTASERASTKTTAPERASTKAPPSRKGTKFIGGHFPKSVWDTFRILGIEQEKSGQDLLQEAMDDLFTKYRKRLSRYM